MSHAPPPDATEASPGPDAAPGPTPGRLAAGAAVALAVLELLLALVAQASASTGWCPTEGASLSCAAVTRPRVAALLGPVTVTHAAFAGAAVTLGLSWCLALLRSTRPALARHAAWIVAAGAGFALGIQPLAWTATGSLCPFCLALVAAALLAAALVAAAARRAGVSLRGPLAALAAALLLTAPLAAWRGRAVAAEDARRRAAVLEAGGARGPRLLLVQKEGCPYCHAFLVDFLGAPEALALLDRTRGVEPVAPSDPRAHRGPRASRDRVPRLLALDPQGELRGPLLVGVPERAEGLAWLREAAADAATEEP